MVLFPFRYVEYLVKNCNIPLENITFMGHSLGAHISGFAAKKIQKSIGQDVSRLIAFDPAAPLFSLNNCENRLCQTDAIEVITLHTSDLGLSSSTKNLSDTTYQFNNARVQPGCGKINHYIYNYLYISK